MPRVERWCVQGRPVVVTGGVTGKNPWGEAGGRKGDPNGFSEQLQGRCGGVDEGVGDIARVFVFGAGAVRLLGMSRRLIGGGMLLFGAAAGDLFPLRGRDAAPAHREADAEGEDQGCEAGEHEMSINSVTLANIQWFQAMSVPELWGSVRELSGSASWLIRGDCVVSSPQLGLTHQIIVERCLKGHPRVRKCFIRRWQRYFRQSHFGYFLQISFDTQ